MYRFIETIVSLSLVSQYLNPVLPEIQQFIREFRGLSRVGAEGDECCHSDPVTLKSRRETQTTMKFCNLGETEVWHSLHFY